MAHSVFATKFVEMAVDRVWTVHQHPYIIQRTVLLYVHIRQRHVTTVTSQRAPAGRCPGQTSWRSKHYRSDYPLR